MHKLIGKFFFFYSKTDIGETQVIFIGGVTGMGRRQSLMRYGGKWVGEVR
jgi:hypothetical protein